MLNWLKEHFKNTPISQIREDWKLIEEQFPTGVKASEYLEYTKALNQCFTIKQKILVHETLISSNLTSNFSGSFFFINIAS